MKEKRSVIGDDVQNNKNKEGLSRLRADESRVKVCDNDVVKKGNKVSVWSTLIIFLTK